MSNIDLVKNLYDAFARGDVPAVFGLLSPEMRWSEAEGNPYRPGPEPFIGPESVGENLFSRLATEWDGFSVHPASYHAAGDTVVVEGRYKGVFKATGRTLDAQFCHVWAGDGEALTRFQQYADTAQLRAVMGAG